MTVQLAIRVLFWTTTIRIHRVVVESIVRQVGFSLVHVIRLFRRHG